MKKKIVSLTAALAMIISMLSGMTLTAHAAFGGGIGTASNPYLISSAEQLKELATEVNGGTNYSGQYFKLTRDINLGGSASNQWTPIGKYNSLDDKSFDGIFDGNGHKISGLYTDRGLFAKSGGTIKNLTVSGTVSITGDKYNAGICAESSGIIESCANEAAVSSNAGYSAGICSVNSGTIKKCYNKGAIDGENGAGICAVNNTGGIIEDCYNTGALTIDSDSFRCSGICTFNYGTIRRTYNIGTLTGSGSATLGGVCASNSNSSGQITSSYYLNASGVTDSKANRLTEELLANQSTFSGWDFTNTWKMDEALGRPLLRTIDESAVSTSVESGTINTPYSGNISTAMNVNAANNTFECIGSFRPAGLDFDGEAFTQSGIVAGTPTASGNYAMFVRATDTSGNSNVDLIHIYIAPVFPEAE